MLLYFIQLAGSLLPQEIYPGVLATSVKGLLSINSGKNTFHPLSHPSPKRLWGQTSAEGLIGMLQEVSVSAFEEFLNMSSFRGGPISITMIAFGD